MRSHFTVLSLLLFALGCGNKIAPVSGQITVDGKPMAGVSVSFQPIAESSSNPGPGSTGKTDELGRYVLQVVGKEPRPGAVVGKHRVSVSLLGGKIIKNGKITKKRKQKIDAIYNSKSELVFEVPPGGTTEANFEVTEK